VILLWWLFFSRAPWSERLGAVAIMALAVVLLYQFAHISIRTGNMGFLVPGYLFFILPPVLVAWAVLTRRSSAGLRRATMVVSLALAAGSLGILRTEGVKGGGAELKWRWTPTAEERLLAQAPPLLEPAVATPGPIAPAAPVSTAAPGTGATVPHPGKSMAPAASEATAAPEWPGFRGPRRDGSAGSAIRINADWTAAPPRELWRRAVGPGWSSFAVQGDLFYTQEQRGESELVSCYRVSTGAPVWQHRDAARFWESNGGPGPRATPSLAGGRVYSLGATGILNVLDARTGAKIWSRQAATDTGAELPIWGFTASPLVLDDVVVVATSGRMIAYELATGTPRWKAPPRRGTYSSPHLVTVAGVPQILLLTGDGATSVSPATGQPLWDYEWKEGPPVVQPSITADGDILVNSIVATGGLGLRRLHITRAGEGWKVDEQWVSAGLKPYFSDYVLHNGYAYGFDGSILSAVNLADGRRVWKGGRYGEGQMLLLPEQNLLLVIGEEGDLALVKASPDGFAEVARMEALHSKTWNHPVLVNGVLLVRNGEEMAAFRLK
jgi:outer membrane protein assembly factor BamB